jgi:GT2 family glycosyltransferase
MDITVVIPTRDRNAVACETLRRLARQTGDARFEVIVIDDGSSDGTAQAVRELAEHEPLELRLFEQNALGPAAARNRAMAAARAPVCLFLNDDTWPRPDLLERHARFHSERPEPTAALLGRIAVTAEPPPTPFMCWLGEQRFVYEGMRNRDDAGGARFFTANVSAKTELLRDAGGFDETFPRAGHEDIELGLRLEKRGMSLAYDEDAVVEHFHPVDLAGAIRREYGTGETLAMLVERHPEWPVPRPPGLRHRVKASALTLLTAMGASTPRLKREVWRFLCHEASREGYWGVVTGTANGVPPPGGVRIGRRLSDRATRDKDVRLPDG